MFNADFGVSFTPEQIERGDTGYNYGVTPYGAPDLPGTSIFAMDASWTVFHTCSTYARWRPLLGAFAWLNLTPKGRNEEGIMSWVRLHDEYDTAPHTAAPCYG